MEVSIEETAECIADGFVGIVSFDEDGVDGGDASAEASTGAFDELGEEGEDAGWVAAGGWNFAGGEADFALGHGEAGDGVHEEEDILAGLAVGFSDRGCGFGSEDALGGGLIAGGDDGHAFSAAFFAEIAFEKFANFAASFADERDDHNIGGCAAGEHAEEGTFADPGSSEDTESLTDAESQEGVDSADLGGHDLVDGWSIQSGDGSGIAGDAGAGRNGAKIIDRIAGSIEDASDEFVAHHHGAKGLTEVDGVALIDSFEDGEWGEESRCAAEADGFGEERSGLSAVDQAERTDGDRQASDFDGLAFDGFDATDDFGRNGALERVVPLTGGGDLGECVEP